MNQQNQQSQPKPVNPAVVTAQTAKAEPTNGAPAYKRPDPKETAQDAVHEIQPKEAVIEPLTPVPAKDPMSPPMVATKGAAKGDDDLMSKPEKQS